MGASQLGDEYNYSGQKSTLTLIKQLTRHLGRHRDASTPSAHSPFAIVPPATSPSSQFVSPTTPPDPNQSIAPLPAQPGSL